MVVRYNTEDGGHAYETIDFRETAPAASNETVSCHPTSRTSLIPDVLYVRRQSDQVHRRRPGRWCSRRDSR